MLAWIIFGSPFGSILSLLVFSVELFYVFSYACAFYFTSTRTKGGKEWNKERNIRTEFIDLCKREARLDYFKAEQDMLQSGNCPIGNLMYERLQFWLTEDEFERIRKKAEAEYERKKLKNWYN